MNKNITLNIIAFFFKLDFRFFEMYLLLIYFRLGPFDPLKYVTSIEKQVVLFFFYLVCTLFTALSVTVLVLYVFVYLLWYYDRSKIYICTYL